MKRKMVAGFSIVVSVLVVAWMISCGGGGSGGGSSDFSGFVKTLDLGSRAQDIPLEAGETWSLAFSVDLDMGNFGGPYTSFMMNFEENLPGLIFSTLTTTGLSAAVPLGTSTGTLTVYVASIGAADPCTEGLQYGPFTVTLDDSDQPESVSPSTASASQSTVDLINIGAFSICVEIESPVDAIVSKDEAKLTACTESIADIAGTWAGTYYCTGSPSCAIGDPDNQEEIRLRITQSSGTPGYANYNTLAEDDGPGLEFYSGNVCGYSFSFEGGGPGYDESGIFIMDPGGLTATKTSYYEDNPGPCSGNCYDTLTREVIE